MRRIIILCFLAFLLLGAAAHAEAESRYVLITILHTNDMHGHVMPADTPGGLARAATLVRQIRADMPNVLLLDAGDTIHGTPEEYFSGGQAIMAAMNAAGYNAATTGNHEFDFGLDKTKACVAAASFPFLAANVRAASGGQWDDLKDSIILNIDGVRVGVLGLATLDTITLHWPDSIKDIAIADPIETAKTLIPELRKQVDVLVVLSHLGDVEDAKLAQAVPGIDFVVGGHTHTPIKEWRWVGDTLITQAGGYASYLGRLDFIVKADGNACEIASVNGKSRNWSEMADPPLGKKFPNGPLLTVDGSVPEDPAVRTAYMPYRAAAEASMAEVIAQAPQAIPGGLGETAIGDLVADAVRTFAGSDVAILDANSISKEGLAVGPVTVGMAFNLIGGYTRQGIVAGTMTGAELKLALEKRAASLKGLRAQVSGISFDWVADGGSPSVANIRVSGEPLDVARSYTVAAQAYVMMDLMKDVPTVAGARELNGTTREAIIGYVKAQRTLVAPALERMLRSQPKGE